VITFIRGMASIGAVLIGLSAAPTRAGYIVDLTQQGNNVVASGSGAIDLTGLSFDGGNNNSAFIGPSIGLIYTGPAFPDLSEVDRYNGITGPTSFGSGGESFPISGSGDLVGLQGDVAALFVPTGYVSGDPLSDTSTYSGQTFATLGVTPGRYEWTWGTGANQNFTLVVEIAAIPEPSTWAMMVLGFAGLGFMGYRSAGWCRATASNA
jgi:hypothetical protein